MECVNPSKRSQRCDSLGGFEKELVDRCFSFNLDVALVLVLEFSNLLTQCVQSWTKLETSIGAVSRVQRFIQTTPSEAPGSVSLPPEFPRQGLIRLDSLTAGYG